MQIVALYKALSDESRLRILRALREGSFNVQEITSIVALSQPTVSHHLKHLQHVGLVRSRRDGVRIFYSLPSDPQASPARSIADGFLSMDVAQFDTGFREMLDQDAERLAQVLETRRELTRSFFERVAPEWNSLRTKAQSPDGWNVPTFTSVPLVDLVAARIPTHVDLVELGCGSGPLLDRILPREGSTIAVDYSQAMLDAARRTLGERAERVQFRLGYLEHLPLGDGSVELAVCCMVLHHIARPEEVIRGAHRVLSSGGRLVIADLTRHRDESLRERYAHLWLGFEPEEAVEWLRSSGFVADEPEIFGEKGEVFLLYGRKR